ncbi:unnamed protein product [Enterobius vermicularis]|uniref:RNA transcription, translation and transport factor protein n=1 Tax=Enterobius vermicularis TaxID=51028 RepID=A0A0N4UZF8_ENTVE|nr:unnamed protein product [Enterobius vermicularis]
MSKRKLVLLGYPAEVINFEINLNLDEEHVRELVSWLEDQFIRLYKIDDRSGLRSEDSELWHKAFTKYLADLKSPFSADAAQLKEAIDWILDLAIENLYNETSEAANLTSSNLERLKKKQIEAQKANDPISALDFHSDECKKGIEDLRKLLGIGSHPDPEVVLKGICKVSSLAYCLLINELDFQPSVQLNKLEMGMASTKNGSIDAAVRALRLIHLENLREIQTEINEVIVAIQEITADPKTDKRLGKVGF